jgi:hypothetical protein
MLSHRRARRQRQRPDSQPSWIVLLPRPLELRLWDDLQPSIAISSATIPVMAAEGVNDTDHANDEEASHGA